MKLILDPLDSQQKRLPGSGSKYQPKLAKIYFLISKIKSWLFSKERLLLKNPNLWSANQVLAKNKQFFWSNLFLFKLFEINKY